MVPQRLTKPQVSYPSVDASVRVDFASVINDGEVLVWYVPGLFQTRCILTLYIQRDAPRSPRKPLRAEAVTNNNVPPSTPKRARAVAGTPAKGTPSRNGASSPTKRTRVSQKAEAEAQYRHLVEYAQNLFTSLNKVVFNDGLPADVELHWSKTLRVTAGRASYSRWVKQVLRSVLSEFSLRNRKGEVSSRIDLAVKVLDSEGETDFSASLRKLMCGFRIYRTSKNDTISRNVSPCVLDNQ